MKIDFDVPDHLVNKIKPEIFKIINEITFNEVESNKILGVLNKKYGNNVIHAVSVEKIEDHKIINVQFYYSNRKQARDYFNIIVKNDLYDAWITLREIDYGEWIFWEVEVDINGTNDELMNVLNLK